MERTDQARYAVRLVDASRPGRQGAPDFIEKWVKWGAGLRASQALVRGGKARALMHGRYHVSVKDIQALAKPILRHRIMTNFNADGWMGAKSLQGSGSTSDCFLMMQVQNGKFVRVYPTKRLLRRL